MSAPVPFQLFDEVLLNVSFQIAVLTGTPVLYWSCTLETVVPGCGVICAKTVVGSR